MRSRQHARIPARQYTAPNRFHLQFPLRRMRLDPVRIITPKLGVKRRNVGQPTYGRPRLPNERGYVTIPQGKMKALDTSDRLVRFRVNHVDIVRASAGEQKLRIVRREREMPAALADGSFTEQAARNPRSRLAVFRAAAAATKMRLPCRSNATPYGLAAVATERITLRF